MSTRSAAMARDGMELESTRYNGNHTRKESFANFANLEAFTNVFLHFLSRPEFLYILASYGKEGNSRTFSSADDSQLYGISLGFGKIFHGICVSIDYRGRVSLDYLWCKSRLSMV